MRSSPQALTLVVLAAGSGSRFGGCKQLEPVGPNGETLMDYAAYDARRAGFARIVCVIRRDMETDFRASVTDRTNRLLPITTVFQELTIEAVRAGRRKPWGTGHALLCAAGRVDGSFAVANADDFYGATAYTAVAEFLSRHPEGPSQEYAVVGYPISETLSGTGGVNRAVCRCSSDGWLTGIEEIIGIVRDGRDGRYRDTGGGHLLLTDDTPVSMNLWGFPRSFLNHLRAGFDAFLSQHGSSHDSEFLLPTFVNSLIRAGTARVRLLRAAGAWFGMSHRGDKPRVSRMIDALVARGAYPEHLWE